MKRVRSDWTEVILVCRKCSRRMKGGFGENGELSLAKALRREAGSGKPKRKGTRTAIIEVGCLDVCPKNAVVALAADAPGEWLVVPRGADAASVLARLRGGGKA